MRVDTFFSRVRKVFPEATLSEVIEIINAAMLEHGDLLGQRGVAYISTVSGKRYYSLPDNIRDITSVYYADSDSNYRKIKRLIGSIDVGDPS